VGRSTTSVADVDVDEHVSRYGTSAYRSEARPIIRSETMGGSTINGTVCDEAVGRPSVKEAR